MSRDFSRRVYSIGGEQYPFYFSEGGSDTVLCVSGSMQNPYHSYKKLVDLSQFDGLSVALLALSAHRVPLMGGGEDIEMPGGWIFEDRCSATLSVTEWLAELGYIPKIVVGHSEGGLTVAQAAPGLQELGMEKMVLLSPTPDLGKTPYRLIRLFPGVIFDNFLAGSSHGLMRLPESLNAFRSYVSDAHVSEEVQRRTEIPVIIVYGQNDMYRLLGGGFRAFNEGYENGKVLQLQGRGHFLDEKWYLDFPHEMPGTYPIAADWVDEYPDLFDL